jgi:hypothetical protein
MTPTLPAGFQVMFMAFILQGLSFPAHDFLRGLLFAYGVQLHDLNPNTILHIASFIMLCECFLGIEPHWAQWKRIFGMRHLAPYQAGGFGCFVRSGMKYIILRTPKNNPGWQTKWFYVRDVPTTGRDIGLKEFRAASDLQVRQSWENVVSAKEMAITEPLIQNILELRSTPGKEVTGFQLIRTFIERQIQPLVVCTHCMWEYSGRQDSTRLSVAS